MARIVLNSIVKNEAARIERMLESVAPHIDAIVMADTGSTDDTIALILSFAERHDLPCKVISIEFHDFSQARNEALGAAREFCREWAGPVYFLLVDADMELVSASPLRGGVDRNANLTAPAYTIEQRAGIHYHNTRLIRADVPAVYRFPTHEWLDVSGTVPLAGPWFIDHADGANRPGKFDRDVALLTKELDRDPASQRAAFYLANTYEDAGMHGLAAALYDKRVALGGWPEEVWMSRLKSGRARLAMGVEALGVADLLAAHEMRPWRAEAMYSLAKHYREKNDVHAALPFALAALDIPYPASDVLFVEADLYSVWCRWEFSIVAYYANNPAIRERGRVIAEELAVDRRAPLEIARNNLRFWTRKLVEAAPSFRSWGVPWIPPAGWSASNPGLTVTNYTVHLMIRSGNYTLHPDGSFTAPPGENVQTRLYLAEWTALGGIIGDVREVLKPAGWPEPLSHRVQGFEDPRLNYRDDGLWLSATMMERTPEGYCEVWVARIDDGEELRLADAAPIVPTVTTKRNEKNVVPLDDGTGRFLYLHDPARLIETSGATICEQTPKMALDHLRGGSPLIRFDDGYLSMTHEVCLTGGALRQYLHRWVYYDAMGLPVQASQTFNLAGEQYEYCGGLAWSPWERGVLIGCFGCWDREAHVFEIAASEVRAMLVIQ